MNVLSQVCFTLIAKEETQLTDLLTGEDYSQKDMANYSVPRGANQPLWGPSSAGGPPKTRIIVAQNLGLIPENSEKHPAKDKQMKSTGTLWSKYGDGRC